MKLPWPFRSRGGSDGAAQSLVGSGEQHEANFGFWTAVAFTVNYIMGCGFLGMPHAFVGSGVILGPIVVFFFGFIMNMTKDFMLETMARAEALAQAEEICERVARDGGVDPGSLSSGSGKQAGTGALAVAPAETEYLVSSWRKFEVTDLFAIFMGPRARTVYVTVLSGYMYGALWAYGTVFASSFSANVPVVFLNGGNTCNIEDGNGACLGPFYLWLAVFAVLAVPLACMELREQVSVQVVMFLARLLVVLLMTGTVLAGYSCEGVVFADMGTDHAPNTPYFVGAGLGEVMPVAIYAFIFHHSVPVLSQPVANKYSLPRIFAAAFVITGVAYVALGFIVALWFGKNIDSQCNLNWHTYVGCVAPHANGDPVTVGDRSTGAAVISFIILIFPALDVLSAYPLNAITLGNNLMSACLGEAALTPPTAEQEAAYLAGDKGAVAAAAAVTEAGTADGASDAPASAAARRKARGNDAATPWYLRTKRGHVVTRTVFRLLAAVPPIVAGALSTQYGIDLSQILQFTGLIGVSIAFIIPTILRQASAARSRAAWVLVSRILVRTGVVRTSSSSSSSSSGGDLPALKTVEAGEDALAEDSSETAGLLAAAVESGAGYGGGGGGLRAGTAEAGQVIDAACAAARKLPLDVREALSLYPLDRVGLMTPYSSWIVNALRLDLALLVASTAIAGYVLSDIIKSYAGLN